MFFMKPVLHMRIVVPFQVDPVCISIRPSFLFIDVSVIGLSETQYHIIVKIYRQSGEFTGVDFSRDEASVTFSRNER